MTDPVAIIDFETRSRCDLKKCGAWVYSRDPSTEVLCMAYKIEDEPTKIWTMGERFPVDLRNWIAWGGLIEAHNVEFEEFIWANCKPDWPKVSWWQWRCTAARAARFGLPRKLETVCQILKLPVQKDMVGHKLMLKMSKPKRDGSWHETPEDLQRLKEYCVVDVMTEYHLSKALPHLEPDELKVWQLTSDINRRGIYCDRDTVGKAIAVLDQLKIDADERMMTLTKGAVQSCRQVKVLLEWLASQGWPMDNLTKEMVEKCLARDYMSRPVREALELRQAFSRSSVAKFEAMMKRSDVEDQRIRGHIRYHGAITGRWAGQGVQTQNVTGLHGRTMEDIDEIVAALDLGPKAFIAAYPDPTDALASCLRPCLQAAPGKKLVCADYNAIEARVLNWLIGNEDMLEAFRAGRNIYCEMATKIYGRPIDKYADPEEYKIGKAAVLGLGYGMGPKKYAEKAEVKLAVAEKVVKLFRAQVIGDFWKDLEEAFIKIITEPEPAQVVGKLHFTRNKPFVYLHLPSGRVIAYYRPEVRLEPTPWGTEKPVVYYWTLDSMTQKWVQVSTWGGKLTENVVQAIARDVISEASLQVEDPIVLSVHDELVVEVDENDDGALGRLIETMCAGSWWTEGLPLAAEGWEGRRYRK